MKTNEVYYQSSCSVMNVHRLLRPFHCVQQWCLFLAQRLHKLIKLLFLEWWTSTAHAKRTTTFPTKQTTVWLVWSKWIIYLFFFKNDQGRNNTMICGLNQMWYNSWNDGWVWQAAYLLKRLCEWPVKIIQLNACWFFVSILWLCIVKCVCEQVEHNWSVKCE